MNAINIAPQITPQEQIQKMTGVVQEIWNISPTQQSALNSRLSKARSKHGIASQIPIICKADSCPYKASCDVPDSEIIPGSRCIVEIATLVSRFERYCEEFNIQETDVVDVGQIKHLVDIEIKLLRCNQAIAINPQIIDEIVTAIQHGQKFTKKEINPITQYEIQLLQQHSKILKDLAATREAKKINSNQESSKQAADLVARAAKLQGGIKGVVAPVNSSGFLYIDAEPIDESEIQELKDLSEQG